jgi:Cu-Zn family superoxide dismutase
VNATFIDAERRTIGEAHLKQTPHGVLLTIDLTNAPPGVRAVHLHTVGQCDAPTFDSAKAHFAPGGSTHGFLNPQGPHAGDLPNLDIPSTKKLRVEQMLPNVTLDPGPQSLLDADGSALVIHAGKDDYLSDPAGESGDRIACARITSSEVTAK